MLRIQMILITFAVMCNGIGAAPIVIKESSPNGESVIAISSTNPEVEKYILDYAAKRKNLSPPISGARAHSQGTVVQSFSVATPEKTIVGTGRSFGDDSFADPFFAPYFASPSLEGFDIRNWLRNLENIYNPSFAGSGPSVSATAISNNGHVFGKVETRNLDNKNNK